MLILRLDVCHSFVQISFITEWIPDDSSFRKSDFNNSAIHFAGNHSRGGHVSGVTIQYDGNVSNDIVF